MSSMRNFKSGEVIANEGDKATCFYVLIDGKVGVYKEEHKITEFSKPGEIIGEMSLILNKPRSASLIATKDSSLLMIEGDLEDIIKMYPDISKKLIKTLAERLAKSTDNH